MPLSKTADRFSPRSLKSAQALPVRTIESSHELGWTSALVEHQQPLSSPEAFETVPTPDQTIVVMTRGEQELESYDGGAWRKATYGAGAVGMTPPGMMDRLRRRVKREAGPACKVNIYFPRSIVEEAADHLGLKAASHASTLNAHGRADEVVRHVAQGLLRAVKQGAPDIYAETTIRWLTLHVLTIGLATSLSDHVGIAAPNDKRLKRALEFMSHHLAEPISIDLLARESGVSKFHFVRLFQHATGSTPYRYLLAKRLEAARRLLAETDMAIADVAMRCGFPRANHFSTQFRSKFGLSPRDFRHGSRALTGKHCSPN